MERYPKMPTETMPRSGKVSEVVQEWLVKEDGALATRLQNEEITEHYQQNRMRNGVLRVDAPRARSEQLKEDERAARLAALEEQRKYEQYAADADVARRLALQAETEEESRRRRQEEDDFALAARLQEEERQRRRQQREERQVQHEARLLGLEAPVREMRLTEPPGAERVYPDDDLSDLMAPPPLAGQPLSEDDVRSWQEEQDEEVARLLQEQETKRRGDLIPRDRVAAIEAQDRELAKVLQEQERARLRRAKERAKEKRRQRQQRERQAGGGGSGDDLSADSAAETAVMKVRSADADCCPPPQAISPLPSPAELRSRQTAAAAGDGRSRAGPAVQPEVRPRPGPSQPEVRPWGSPSQPEVRPWGAPSQPEVRSRPGPSPAEGRPRGSGGGAGGVSRPSGAGRTQTSPQQQQQPLPPLPAASVAGVSNIAMVIDPTYQRRVASELPSEQPPPPAPVRQHQQSPTAIERLSDADLYEEDEDEPAPPYMPIQGQRRTNSMEKARRRRGKDGANCKQQ
ncbi:mitogen-activated protein kinase 7-like isoform X1 [Amphibalanus amphitrite]|uniref:mitogen-activated protein kinase 7-like isoform X1 n=1 Tax=Amphibalanus amphitrite TaxID=1232801 RepID=UPI001C916BD5|nr:mitogen-activated protein kinase 7-like isoform X1 [Amphibalanus amphitrite]XP_043239792.1 mitogen-activated protein kinase 7-like isoform X1 [Amphibalanus amphitrite]